MLVVPDTRTPARAAAVAFILAIVAILQWTVADWSVLGLGFFNLAPIVLAAIWLGVPGAVVVSVVAGVITTLNLAGEPQPATTGQLLLGFAIREIGYHGMALFIAI